MAPADVHVFDEADFRSHLPSEFEQIHEFVVVEARITTELILIESKLVAAAARIPSSTLACAALRVSTSKRAGCSESKLTVSAAAQLLAAVQLGAPVASHWSSALGPRPVVVV